MDLGHLEDAIALLEEKSLNRAAERRNITQPAFSRRIRAFEQWVGTELLVRHTNRVELSQTLMQGEEEVRSLLARIHRFRRQMREHAAVGGQNLIIATQHALSVSAFPMLCTAFTTRRPNLTWRLRTLNRSECVSMFMRDEADLLLCFESNDLPSLPFDDSIQRRIWRRDTLIPVVGGALRSELQPDGRLPEYTPTVSFPTDSHFGRLVAQAGAPSPFAPAGRSAHVETAFTVGLVELILSGAGVGWVPRSLAEKAINAGEVIDLSRTYGEVPLEASLFAARSNERATDVLAAM